MFPRHLLVFPTSQNCRRCKEERPIKERQVESLVVKNSALRDLHSVLPLTQAQDLDRRQEAGAASSSERGFLMAARDDLHTRTWDIAHRLSEASR